MSFLLLHEYQVIPSASCYSMSVLLQSLLDEKEDLVKEKTQLAELVSCNCLS
jgi:hypothetical protein